MKIAVFLTLCLLIFACNSENSSNKDAKEIQEDQNLYPEFLVPILDSIKDLKRDFKVDSLFLRDTNQIQAIMDIEIVKEFTKKLNNEEQTQANIYYLNDYLKIEKTKRKGSYKQYVDKLDLGMMQDANCYFIGKINYSDSMALIIWSLDFSSYQACPYYEGKHILATIVSNKETIQTMHFASYVANSDPPMDAENYFLMKFLNINTIERKNIFDVKEEDISIESGQKIQEFKFNTTGFFLNQKNNHEQKKI